MTVPGSNLLLQALRLIKPQTVQHFVATGRTTTGAGTFKSTFAPGVPVTMGSVQPVPRDRYDVLGLSLSKSYVNWIVPISAIALQRATSGDQMEWNGRRYQLESSTDWFGQDGWLRVLCVDVGPADA